MNDSARESQPAVSSGPRGRFWQFGLRTLFLFTAAVAVWVAYANNRYQNGGLQARIGAMRTLARELQVIDPSQIAVVKRDELWYDDNQWEIYLPPGPYRLCLATQEIDKGGLAPVTQSASLDGGTHLLQLEQERRVDGWQVTVSMSGKPLLIAQEPSAWDPAIGSTGGGQFTLGEQLPPDKPVVLFRRRFQRPSVPATPIDPCEGVLLWIEPLP